MHFFLPRPPTGISSAKTRRRRSARWEGMFVKTLGYCLAVMIAFAGVASAPVSATSDDLVIYIDNYTYDWAYIQYTTHTLGLLHNQNAWFCVRPRDGKRKVIGLAGKDALVSVTVFIEGPNCSRPSKWSRSISGFAGSSFAFRVNKSGGTYAFTQTP